jgi:hypothetical protein
MRTANTLATSDAAVPSRSMHRRGSTAAELHTRLKPSAACITATP